MRNFHCSKCGELVFFENSFCGSCGSRLAFDPDGVRMLALAPAGDGQWRAEGAEAPTQLCLHYERSDACNWAVAPSDGNPLCKSCRLTRTLPNLDTPGNFEAWFRIENAKRRLVYDLIVLGLEPRLRPQNGDTGAVFDFLEDAADPSQPPVLTGHDSGVITLNIAEADDVERERRRALLGEPYRALLGHLRHEIGHYFWDRIVAQDGERLGAFRALFGDERADYQESLRRHYAGERSPDWQARCITEYASAHPWEDWAESWAHYLHMRSALETAQACGLRLLPGAERQPALAADALDLGEFDSVVKSWPALSYLINHLNRSLGLRDPYPFVLSGPAVEKLRFAHDAIRFASPVAALGGSGGFGA